MATATREQVPREAFRGMYLAPNASLYIRATFPPETHLSLPSTKLLRWIRTGVAGDSYQGIPGKDILIDFEDLISMRVISALRGAGVTWPKIWEGENWLKENTTARKPFATMHIWSGSGDIFTEWSRRLIAASRHGQLAFDILRDFIIPVHGLGFDEHSKVARWWEPSSEVRLHPEIQFGAPCIAGTRIPTQAVVGAVNAGDPKELVQKAYEITAEQLEAALVWESRLRSAA